jgi:hypothetical protein
MAEIWQHIDAALADASTLATELKRLRAELADTHLNRANLAAAALATIHAYRDGEHDPLSYLHDELKAQVYPVRERS